MNIIIAYVEIRNVILHTLLLGKRIGYVTQQRCEAHIE